MAEMFDSEEGIPGPIQVNGTQAQWFLDLMEQVDGITVNVGPPQAPPREEYREIRETSCMVCRGEFGVDEWKAYSPPSGHPMRSLCFHGTMTE